MLRHFVSGVAALSIALAQGKPAPDVATCFHEHDSVQFAPAGSAFDREGLIVHDGADFGDTAQREGWYWLGVWIRQHELKQPWTDNPPRTLSFDDVLRKLEPEGNGVFVRAPGKDPFGRPLDGHKNHGLTRDQIVPLVAAMAVWEKKAALQRLWNALPEDMLGKHDLQGHWLDETSQATMFVLDPCASLENVFEKAACEVKKRSGFLHFTGDPLPPTAYTLFLRAGVNPVASLPVAQAAVSEQGFAAGDVNLKLGIDVLRNQATGDVSCEPVKDPRDCVDQDMNSLVMLWMSRHTRSTDASKEAIASYRSRAHSYGSYFGEYCKAFGPLALQTTCAPNDPDCCDNKGCLNDRVTARIKAGVAKNWPPDGPGFGPYGALRWYHRWSAGANPQLAVLWKPIVEDLLK